MLSIKNTITAAQELADYFNWAVFPVNPKTKTPYFRGWQEIASSNPGKPFLKWGVPEPKQVLYADGEMAPGVAYVRSHKVEAASAGGSEANRGRREVATFATARFN